ncbi:MAG TPA: hypothetical protein PLD52_10255, partial [Bacteroidales bacterium]|nr:hypothetical protein [Bacteroidales bacterium]
MKFSIKKRALPLFLFLAALSFFGFAYTGYHFLSSREPDIQAPPDTTLTSNKNTVDSVYLSHVHAADIFIRQKKYEEALTELNKAITIKPNETILKNKIVQATGLLEQQKKDNAEFARLIASADAYFKTKAYLDAKSTYQLALDLKPGDAYAQQRLKETMDLLRAQMAQNILYDVAVANADKFYEAGELDKAKAEYEKASQMLPSDQHAKERLNEIIKIQVDKQVKEELYNQAITKGDQLYQAKKYSGALTEFRNALKQKPDEKYPQDRVKELTDLLNQLRAMDEAYQNALAVADQHFLGKRYAPAKTGYQDALKIKPDEVYPKNRIKEIDDILAANERSGAEYDQYIALADSFYIEKNFIRARQNYQLALKVKPNEAYPKEMLSKTDQGEASLEQMKKTLEEQYAFLITNADQLLAGKEYADARTKYTEALGLKPAESYPKTKLAEIETALAAIEKQKSLDEKYQGLITEADQLLGSQSYEPAKTKYQAASSLKPSEEYPKTKIKEIDESLAAIGKQKALDQQYQRVIAEADQLLGNKSYEKARTTYQSASDLKPAEEYPKTRITEIDGIMAAAAAKQKELDDQYASVIANADQLLAAKDYDNAKTKYTEALGINPAETYPKTKITEIDAALEALAQQRSLDEQYQGVIATADQLFGEKSYDQAKAKYQAAATLKPAEAYPKTRIAEIDRIVAEAAA